MTEIKFAIEGEDAITATEELLAIEGITGNYTVNSEDVKKEAVITTVATIVGLVGGAIAIAEQIRKWYQEYQQNQSGKKIAKVLIVGRNGRRLLLENATIDEIRQILES
ncbi:hypothetical protein [Anabaena sp. WA102]|jgi:hypothetical protein|uniref:hypothetical protein n=1 Tax=Anabaena sp. WA102 TaxID=1647413 RepID=UPI0006AC9718|nr:hypothetical protein [Anabaena sp. WA102]